MKKKKIIIGIDFGTTCCLVSTVINNKIIVLDIFNKKKFFPTIVHFKKNNTIIGWKAQKFLRKDVKNTITSIKRFIGVSYSELKKKKINVPYKISTNENKELVFHTNIGKITVSGIIQKIFTYIKNKIEKNFQTSICGAIITVPAYFNNIQKKTIRKSAKLINLKLLRLLNEPTAAAIAYGLEKQRKGFICVYDIGGGTFDVSILKISEGIFEVLATNGDCHLGGDDFDRLLASFLYSKIKNKPKITDILFKKLLVIAEKVKIQLSKKSSVTVELLHSKINCSVLEFNVLIDPYIKKTLNILKQALQDASVKKSNIKDIILVGGSTYIPLIRKKIHNFFKKKTLQLLNPVEVVAHGAGLQANFLYHKKNKNIQSILLLDIVSISIGIELLGGIMEKMIVKGSKIPTEVVKIFTTFKDNQTGFCINIFQGESKYVKNCKLLKKFKIKKLPPKKAGEIKIVIAFRIDADNLLSVTTQEQTSKIRHRIQMDTIYHNKNINKKK
ncbi:Chaperone protein HscA [Buchnera aphidicola (Cinara splendens)]|uniref:Chaperone protein HscA, partial n=2 Tax=Buchnera aphidicola TaxID=9 RepID=A0A451DES4_9GAMM|nr:Chaperone protein HscA [Buchnera aphidicola (Cinara splendens)]